MASVKENAKSLAAGGFGGVCAVLTGHPFDLIKVRLQTGHTHLISAAVTQILKDSGPRGFYRGVTPPLLGVTPMFAVSFWGYDVGKYLVAGEASHLTIPQTAAAGFFSAIPTTLIAAPFERVKVVLQIQKKGTQTSMTQAISTILKTGGLRLLYKGSLATLARDGPGSAVYFAVYEKIKKELLGGEKLSLPAITLAGGFAGVAMWTVVFPADTIKSVQQLSSESLTMAEVLRRLYAKGGVKAFFPGLGPALLRSFPANAATFVGLELAKNVLEKF